MRASTSDAGLSLLDGDRSYFELFDLPQGFDVEQGVLASRYRELQRRVHPDRYAAGSDTERRLSMQLTTLVNEAYQTLRDPVRRARYLLSLAGGETADETDTAMDPGFLMEQMELREALADIRATPEPHKQLAELANQTARRFALKSEQFRQALTASDLASARNVTREMQFLDKLRIEIEDMGEGLA